MGVCKNAPLSGGITSRRVPYTCIPVILSEAKNPSHSIVVSGRPRLTPKLQVSASPGDV